MELSRTSRAAARFASFDFRHALQWYLTPEALCASRWKEDAGSCLWQVRHSCNRSVAIAGADGGSIQQ